MTQLWYQAYQTYGNRAEIVARLSTAITRNGLNEWVARLCYEKAHPQAPQRESFYLFLGFNTEVKGQLPPTVQARVEHLGLGPCLGLVEYADIRTMVIGDLDSMEYAAPQSRQRQAQSDLSTLRRTVANGFGTLNQRFVKRASTSADPAPAPSPSPPNSPHREVFNQLLYWLSSKGEGSWEQFRQVCRTLGLTSEAGWSAHRIMRRLRLLGHVEYRHHPKPRRWWIAPPCLVLRSHTSDGCVAYLAGQRTPSLLDSLRQRANLSRESQAHLGAPDWVGLTSDSLDQARHLTESTPLRWAGDAAHHLSQCLPDVTGYQATLQTLPTAPVLSKYSVRRWCQGNWEQVGLPSASGLYELQATATAYKKTFFYEATSDRWFEGDWYGLRFLSLHHAGQRCPVRYDSATGQLALPTAHRWPDWYERALVLASGRLPSEENGWLHFEGVSSHTATMLIEKLNCVS